MTSPLDRLAAALAGRYTIERELGAGGMATVYLAQDPKHHRKVAIKVLKSELAAAIGSERFLREIEITANLRHPHILPLYDSGEADGFLYYVMPLVEGESLAARLDREKQLPLADALQITREVADALSYAHSHGVIHRDIKPENILLESGHAVVADFGIARAITAAGGEKLTETGITLGTPLYMSPEQASGSAELDGRSDQYSLGCVLYQMLAGQPPFTGPTVQSVVHQHLTAEARPVTQLRAAVPRAVADVLARTLAKAPADRFTPVGRLIEALDQADRVPWPPRSGRRLAMAAVALAVLILVSGLVVLARRTPRIAVTLGRRAQVTLDPGLELDPALSPDGKFVAYSGSNGNLIVRQAENGVPLRVVREGDPTGRWPAWLPDGQRLVYISPRGIEIVSALGGVPRLLVSGTGLARGVSVAPDGRSLVYTLHDSLYVKPMEDGPARLLTVGREVYSFAWSPDGRWIAYVSGNIQYVNSIDLGNVAPSSIWVVPAAGGAAVPVTDSRALNVSPAWAGPRSLLFLSSRDGGRDVYQVEIGASGAARGVPIRLTTGLNALGIAVSLDGTRLAYSAFTETSNIWSIPIPATGAVSASRATPVTLGNQTIENLGVSADGKSIAFSSDRAGVGQIYRMPLGDVSAEPRQLTADTAGSYWAAWSPDGKEIAFHRFQGERRITFVVPAEGGAPVQVSDGRDDERTPEWSADGRRLLTLVNWGTHPTLRLYARTADGNWSPPRTFPIVIGADTIASGLSAWSPDGRWLACGCGSGGMVIAPADGGPAHRLPSPYSTAGWAFPQWSADSRTVYHLMEDAERVVAVVAVPVSGGTPRVVVRFDDPTRPWHRFGFKVQGGRFFFTLGDQQSDIWVAEMGRR